MAPTISGNGPSFRNMKSVDRTDEGLLPFAKGTYVLFLKNTPQDDSGNIFLQEEVIGCTRQ